MSTGCAALHPRLCALCPFGASSPGHRRQRGRRFSHAPAAAMPGNPPNRVFDPFRPVLGRQRSFQQRRRSFQQRRRLFRRSQPSFPRRRRSFLGRRRRFLGGRRSFPRRRRSVLGRRRSGFGRAGSRTPCGGAVVPGAPATLPGGPAKRGSRPGGGGGVSKRSGVFLRPIRGGSRYVGRYPIVSDPIQGFRCAAPLATALDPFGVIGWRPRLGHGQAELVRGTRRISSLVRA